MKRIGFIILISVLLFAFITKSKHIAIFTKQAPSPIGPYSQAIKTGTHLYISGQIGMNAEGVLDTLNIETETLQAMENIKAILAASGMGFENVVKTTIYTTDLKKFSQINEVYKKFFAASPPARETVEVKGLPKGAHIEISVIAEN